MHRPRPMFCAIGLWLLAILAPIGTISAQPDPATEPPPEQPAEQPQTLPNEKPPEKPPATPADPPPAPGTVFSLTTVDDTGFWVNIDAGIYEGVMEGMRFDISRGAQLLARVQVVNAFDHHCFARVIPGTKTGEMQIGDTATLLPFVPAPDEPNPWANPTPGTTPPPPANGTSPPPPDPLPHDEQKLRDIIDGLHHQLSDANREVRKLRLERDEERGARVIAESKLDDIAATKPEYERQLQRLHTELLVSTTFGTGASFGVSLGDPLFGSFSLGVERFTLHYGASIDIFSIGPLDGFSVNFDLLETPSRITGGGVETVVRASIGFDLILPFRGENSNTGLLVGYRHHHFPVPFRGIDASGELVISWGRRVPMTQMRERKSFWQYEFRPIIELAHDPWRGTGTDLRLGLGFPDLIEATVNFNWSYFTNTGRFGCLHVAAHIPLLQDHGDMGSFFLMLTGDWVLPFDNSAYDHVGTVMLQLRFNLGR